MFVHATFVLILCATVVLTSTVSESETDGFPKDNRRVFPIKNFHDNGNSSSSTIAPSTTVTNVKNESLSSIIAEGGPIYQTRRPASKSHPTAVIPAVPAAILSAEKIFKESPSNEDPSSKLPKTRNASVVARKGVAVSSKITARKGVGQESVSSTESTPEGPPSRLVSPAKASGEKKIEPIVAELANVTGPVTTEKMPFFKHTKINLSVNDTIDDNASNRSVDETKKFSVSSTITKIVPTVATKFFKNTTLTPTKRFKAKPTVTIGEMDIDKPIPASPTKTPALGTPRKIDYIVPVIITIMALPLLGAVTFFLYRRGRDCWDKRHYRRMDFLIDGMYNDYSWK